MIKKAREDAKAQVTSVESEYLEKQAEKQAEYDKKYNKFEKEIIKKNSQKEEELFKAIDSKDLQEILESKPFECEVKNEKIDEIVDLLIKAVSLE